jgi:S-adenosylmethionine decarboxylase
VILHVALAIVSGVPRAWLDDEAAVRGAVHAAIAAGGFTELGDITRRFAPQGVTACAVLGESHLAVHTWPEEGRLFVDVASCASEASVARALEALAAAAPNGRLEQVQRCVLSAT